MNALSIFLQQKQSRLLAMQDESDAADASGSQKWTPGAADPWELQGKDFSRQGCRCPLNISAIPGSLSYSDFLFDMQKSEKKSQDVFAKQ